MHKLWRFIILINIKGRCKIKNSKGIIETQIMYIDEDEIERLLKDNLKA
jgi:hypothetical protein